MGAFSHVVSILVFAYSHKIYCIKRKAVNRVGHSVHLLHGYNARSAVCPRAARRGRTLVSAHAAALSTSFASASASTAIAICVLDRQNSRRGLLHWMRRLCRLKFEL